MLGWGVNMLRFVLYGASAKVHCFAFIQINDDLLNRIVRNGDIFTKNGSLGSTLIGSRALPVVVK